MEGIFEIPIASIRWLVEQLQKRRLRWSVALLVMGLAMLIGSIVGWISSRSVLGAGLFAFLGFPAGTGILYVIIKRRELEREWEWTKMVEPPEIPNALSDRFRHE